jgi:hypothetical protein
LTLLNIPVPSTAGKIDAPVPVSHLARKLRDDGLVPRIRELVREQQSHAINYLKQMRVIGQGKIILADVGYTGTIGVYINNYLLREAPDLIARTRLIFKLVASGSYFEQNRTFGRPVAEINQGILFTNNGLPAILSDNFAWLECMFKDLSRGPLRGYRIEGNKIVPDFLSPASSEVGSLRDFEDAAVDRLSNGLEALKYATPSVIERIRTAAISFFVRPQSDVVQAASELVQEADGLNGEMHSIIDRARTYELIRRIRKWKSEDYWISGSLIASGRADLVDRYDLLKAGTTRIRRIKTFFHNRASLIRRVVRKVVGK